jgi:broad specificity phosphatase PhoE
MFEVMTGPFKDRFHTEIVQRTPWTRQFRQRQTEGPNGETIDDLIDWTRRNWSDLVLKPERG